MSEYEGRSLDEVKEELMEALVELRDQEAEVCHAKMNRDTVLDEVMHYRDELYELGLTLAEIEAIGIG